MAHGKQNIIYRVCVSSSNSVGKTYEVVGKFFTEKKAYAFLKDYTKTHREVMSAYIDKVVSFRNNKRQDWED